MTQKNHIALRTIFDWFMSVDLSTFNAGKAIKTDYGDMVQEATLPPVQQFIKDKASEIVTSPGPVLCSNSYNHYHQVDADTLFATDLYNMYEEWRISRGIEYKKKCQALIPEITHMLGANIVKSTTRHAKGTRYVLHWRRIYESFFPPTPNGQQVMEEYVSRRNKRPRPAEYDSEDEETPDF
jgi:hypothetical protein